jgi:protein associated with RNAse G/E
MHEDASVVRVRYFKFDGSAHRSYPAIRLGSDVHGDWLGVPSGEFIEAAITDFKYTDPYVLLVPPHAWWTAMFNRPPRRTEVYCDITTPAVWDDEGVVLTDLDLDVRRRREHLVVELVDEDEFAENRLRYGYPDDVVAAAWDAADWLLKSLDDGTEPFRADFQRWLDKVA